MVKATCAVPDCDRDVVARGWCTMHYQRWQKNGDPLVSRRVRRYCTVEGCEKRRFGNGYCKLHYDRWRKHGDPSVYLLDRQHDGACAVDGCERPYKGRGYCYLHLRRLKETGTVDPRPAKIPSLCSVDGCDRTVKCKGLCSLHYGRMRATGVTDEPVPKAKASCSIEGCDRTVIAREWCSFHYQRWSMHGDPTRGGRPKLWSAAGLVCSIEECGKPYASNGFCTYHALRDYQRRNPDKVRAWRQRRGARLKANPGTERQETIEYRSIIIGDPCVYCGAPAKAIDHIQPVAQNGADSWENMAPVCSSCNSSKQAKDLLQFLLYRLGGGAGGRRVRPGTAPRAV